MATHQSSKTRWEPKLLMVPEPQHHSFLMLSTWNDSVFLRARIFPISAMRTGNYYRTAVMEYLGNHLIVHSEETQMIVYASLMVLNAFCGHIIWFKCYPSRKPSFVYGFQNIASISNCLDFTFHLTCSLADRRKDKTFLFILQHNYSIIPRISK